MSASLGLTVLAEGVETAEQAAFLTERGCRQMQGYFFHRPLPVDEFERVAETASATAGTALGV